MPAAPTLRQRLFSRAARSATVKTLHQAIAFDALQDLAVADASRWAHVFIGHARVLALGAAAPDVDFRDFRNHLLFPNDDLWGGAAAKANCWHRNLIAALARSEWENASYCAGVLSHYVVDALHPFHTAQSQADNDAHAALAYSTYVNYGDLISRGRALPVQVQDRENCSAAAAVISGAVAANRRYDALLSNIDIERLSSDPRHGLNAQCKALLSEYLRDATGLVSALIGSAIEHSAARPPQICAARAGRSAAAIPFNMFARWRHTRSLRLAAHRASCEFATMGHVIQTAPPEVCIKRALYAREVVAKVMKEAPDKVVRLAPTPTARERHEVANSQILPFDTAPRKTRIALQH